MSIKVCIESKGTKNVDFGLKETIQCEAGSSQQDDYLKWVEEKGIAEKNCFNFTVDKCENKCDKDFSKRVFAKNIQTLNHEGMIMQEILFSGPVIATFDLYSDFLEYRGGVYTHQSGEYLGKHSVLLIGYVRDGNYQHWIAKNSFGTSWGESGYFRIPFDHLGICENVKTFSPLYKYQ